MKKKKLLVLGGSKFQIPAIIEALQMNCEVITCDYLPDNPGHKYADKYYNVSTTDIDKIIEVSIKENIDGILAYASDPAALTAATVSFKLGLPGSDPSSVSILTDKFKFREFLNKNGFNVPEYHCFEHYTNAKQLLNNKTGQWIIKPVDSSGSRGVSKIFTANDFETEFNMAISFSKSKKIIIERVIDTAYSQLHSNCFIQNGKLLFALWGDHFFRKEISPFVPVATFFPSVLPVAVIHEINDSLQKFLQLLNLGNCALDVEVRIDKEGNFYFIEAGPRTGGDYVPQVVEKATGFPLTKACIEASLGITSDYACCKTVIPTTYLALGSDIERIFNGLDIKPDLRENIKDCFMHVQPGESILPHSGANTTFGHLILQFENYQDMKYKIENIDQYLKLL